MLKYVYISDTRRDPLPRRRRVTDPARRNPSLWLGYHPLSRFALGPPVNPAPAGIRRVPPAGPLHVTVGPVPELVPRYR